MPLHLQSITDNDRHSKYIACLLTEVMDDYDSVFVSSDKFILIQKTINDVLTGAEIGKLVYTLKTDDEAQTIFIIDLDIMLEGAETTRLRFLELLEGSSDANEYYEAEITENGGHLEIETVNRHTVDGEIVGTEHEVRISAFPFKLNVFDDIIAFNRFAGFTEEIEVADTGFKVFGLSETFIMPGSLSSQNRKEDEHYSFLLGTVRSFSDVRWQFGENTLDFVLVYADTALGCIPVAMSRDVFDLSCLKAGSILAMNADIKADLSKPEDFFS